MTRLRWFVLCAALLLSPAVGRSNPIVGVPTGTAGFVGQAEFGPLDQPTLVTSYGDYVAVFGSSAAGLTNPYLAPSVAAFFANGGQGCWIVRVPGADDASFIGVDAGPGQRTGLQALRDVEEVPIVAAPGATALAVQASMIALCESEGDRMAVLDPASTNSIEVVLNQRAGLGSANGFAALYFPWIQGSPAGVSLLLPPSGFVAGVVARTSPPDSPVGAVATATGLSRDVTDAEQDILNPAGVNAIRSFPGQGILVWGTRTLSSDPEWRYVPVRRTALYLENSIYEGTEWAVFEPNDATLWATLQACIDTFMYDHFLQGWFQGATASEAYFVRVDATTTTPTDIEQGRTVMLVGFAPLRPAEFILLQIVQQRSTGTAVEPPSPAGLRLLPAAPNPFNPLTSIRFDLATPAVVDLTIHDVAGHRVRTLLERSPTPAGAHNAIWNGADDHGLPVASGVYLLRLSAGTSARSTRVTLVR